MSYLLQSIINKYSLQHNALFIVTQNLSTLSTCLSFYLIIVLNSIRNSKSSRNVFFIDIQILPFDLKNVKFTFRISRFRHLKMHTMNAPIRRLFIKHYYRKNQNEQLLQFAIPLCTEQIYVCFNNISN